MSISKAKGLMLYREIIAVCSEIHIKHLNTLCGQNVELASAKLVVCVVSMGPYRGNWALEEQSNGCGRPKVQFLN